MQLDPNTGALGILTAVLSWFMFKSTAQQESTSKALNALTRAILMEVLTRAGAPAMVKHEARATLRTLGVDLEHEEILVASS